MASHTGTRSISPVKVEAMRSAGHDVEVVGPLAEIMGHAGALLRQHSIRMLGLETSLVGWPETRRSARNGLAVASSYKGNSRIPAVRSYVIDGSR